MNQILLTPKGKAILTDGHTMLSDYWIGFYGLAYVPSPRIPDEGPSTLIGAGEEGDYIFNIWQGDMTSSGFATGSFTGLTLYDKNITSNYRYVYDAEKMYNQLVTWSTTESNQYGRNAFNKENGPYKGVRRTDDGTGSNGTVEPSEIPMPAPLFFCGNRFTFNQVEEFDLANVPKTTIDGEVVPMVTPDMRNYPSDAIELDPNGPYNQPIEGNPGMYSSVASDDNSRMRDGEYKTLADQFNGLLSISNYNKTHGHVSSEGFPIDYQEVCHNMSRATRLFPISAYKVNSVSETEDPGTEGVAKAKTLEYKIDIDIRNGSLAKNLLQFTGTGLFAGKEACSFKFNRIGIYAVPVSLHRFAKEGDSGTVCSDSHVQVEISPDAEPVLFAVALVDEIVMSEDGSLGSNRYQLDFSLNLVDASGDCALVRDVDVYYNMYENQAITWYQNQLLATAGMSEAITSLGVDVAYLKNRNAGNSTPLVIENNTNGDGFGGNGLKHLFDAGNPGALRGSDTKGEEGGYAVGIDSVALGKDTGVTGEASFITGRGALVQGGDSMAAIAVSGLQITADSQTQSVVVNGAGSGGKFTNVRASRVSLYGNNVDMKDIMYSDVTNVSGGYLHGIARSIVHDVYVPDYVGEPEFNMAKEAIIIGGGTTIRPIDDVYGISQTTMFGNCAVGNSGIIGSGNYIYGSVGYSLLIGNTYVSTYSPNYVNVVIPEGELEPSIVPDPVTESTKVFSSIVMGSGMYVRTGLSQSIVVGGGCTVSHDTTNSILVGNSLYNQNGYTVKTATEIAEAYGGAGGTRPTTPVLVTKDDTTSFTLTDEDGENPTTFDFDDMPVENAEYMVVQFKTDKWYYEMPGTGVAGNSDPSEWADADTEWKEKMHTRNYWLAVKDFLEHRGPDKSVIVGSSVGYGLNPTCSIVLGDGIKMSNLHLTDSIIMSNGLDAFNHGDTYASELATLDYGAQTAPYKTFSNVKIMTPFPKYVLRSFERSGDTTYKDAFIFAGSSNDGDYALGAWMGLGFNSESYMSNTLNSLPLVDGTYETRHVYAAWDNTTHNWKYGLSKDGAMNQPLPMGQSQYAFNLTIAYFLAGDTDGNLYKHLFADQGKPNAHMIYTGGIALAGSECQDKYGADSSYGFGLLKLGSCYGSAYIKSFMRLPTDSGWDKARFNMIDYSVFTSSWENGHTWQPGRARVFPHKILPGTTDCPYGGRPLVVDYEQELDGTFHIKLGDPVKAEAYGNAGMMTGTHKDDDAIDLLQYDGQVIDTDSTSYIEVKPPSIVGQRTVIRTVDDATLRVSSMYCADDVNETYRELYSGYVYCLESMKIEGKGLYWKVTDYSRPA